MKGILLAIGLTALVLLALGTTNALLDDDFTEDFVEHELFGVDLMNLTGNMSWNYKQHIDHYQSGSLGVQIDV